MSKHSSYALGKKEIAHDVRRSLSDVESCKQEWEQLARDFLSTPSLEKKVGILEEMKFLESLLVGAPVYRGNAAIAGISTGGRREIDAWRTREDALGKELQGLTKSKNSFEEFYSLPDVLDHVEMVEAYEGIHSLVRERVDASTNARDYVAEFTASFGHDLYRYGDEKVFLGKVKIIMDTVRLMIPIVGVCEESTVDGEFFVKKVYEIRMLRDK